MQLTGVLSDGFLGWERRVDGLGSGCAVEMGRSRSGFVFKQTAIPGRRCGGGGSDTLVHEMRHGGDERGERPWFCGRGEILFERWVYESNTSSHCKRSMR